MKLIDNGKGKIPLITLLAILSISLTVNLPGLAISPILGKLDKVFHHVSELETQLLTVLPNLVTIPFILCAGKICNQKNQIFVLGLGLVIFTVSGILSFFADSMLWLILLSCLLGVGCGLVIPLAASLISQNFFGEERTRQLGNKSSLSNFSVIFATLFVGWVAAIDWHLAFIVYMVPIIPLLLIPFMTDSYIARHSVQDNSVAEAKKDEVVSSKQFFTDKKTMLWLLVGLMALYFGMTYATEVVSYYLPFTMQHFGISTGGVGVATAMFFLGATVGGFLLTRIIRLCGPNTMQIAIMMVAGGLLISGFLHTEMTYIIGIFIMGLGYGVVQPVIYDKTAFVAPTPEKSTAYFSYLLTCNYVGISIVPFVISLFKRVMDAESDPSFSFVFNGFIVVAVLVLALWKRKGFVFDATYTMKK